MKTFEYQVVSGNRAIEAKLGEFGAAGWRLAHVLTLGGGDHEFIFEKEATSAKEPSK